MGQDAANPDDADDEELLQRAKQENRTLLTRDKRLAEECQGKGAKCILVKSSRLEDQLTEMAHLGIPLELSPVRCTICNSILRKIEPSKTESEKEVWICEGCGKLYWQGSHWGRIDEMLRKLRSDK